MPNSLRCSRRMDSISVRKSPSIASRGTFSAVSRNYGAACHHLDPSDHVATRVRLSFAAARTPQIIVALPDTPVKRAEISNIQFGMAKEEPCLTPNSSFLVRCSTFPKIAAIVKLLGQAAPLTSGICRFDQPFFRVRGATQLTTNLTNVGPYSTRTGKSGRIDRIPRKFFSVSDQSFEHQELHPVHIATPHVTRNPPPPIRSHGCSELVNGSGFFWPAHILEGRGR